MVLDGISYNQDGVVASSTSGGIATTYGTANIGSGRGLRKMWIFKSGRFNS